MKRRDCDLTPAALPHPILCLVTDLRLAGGERRALECVEAALDGGFNMIQLRAKRLAESDLLKLAFKLRKLRDKCGGALVINSSAAVARRVGADGAHFGRGAAVATDYDGWLSQAAHSVADARAYAAGGRLHYAFLGSVFPSQSHPGLAPLGLERLRQAARHKGALKLVAIGGVNASNAAATLEAGADGVAAMRAVLSAADPARAARRLARAIGL